MRIPRPFLTRFRLRWSLEARAGERILEVGPGIGYYTLHVARWLQPGGTLDVLDVDKTMVDATTRRARQKGIGNIKATQGDAASLPYPTNSFDAAYLVITLGELADQDRAMSELRRVLKPGGRLVIGEFLFDPHMVSLSELLAKAGSAGFSLEKMHGFRFAYFARLRLPRLDSH